MKKIFYPACFYLEDGGAYSVIFPDLNSATCGKDLEQAIYMAEDLLGGLLVSAQDDGETVAPPTDAGKVKADEYPNGFVTLIGVDVDNYRKRLKSVKKTLTIPEWLNEAAVRQNINFSAVLQDALKQQLGL